MRFRNPVLQTSVEVLGWLKIIVIPEPAGHVAVPLLGAEGKESFDFGEKALEKCHLVNSVGKKTLEGVQHGCFDFAETED